MFDEDEMWISRRVDNEQGIMYICRYKPGHLISGFIVHDLLAILLNPVKSS